MGRDVGIDVVTSRVVVPYSYRVGVFIDTPGEGGPILGCKYV